MFKFLCIVVLFALYSCEEDITKGPPTKDKPSVPGWGFWKNEPEAWKNEHMKFVQQTKEKKSSVPSVEPVITLFLGDLYTQGWTVNGKEIWDKNPNFIGAYNYGITSDSTRQILWRIDNGELDGLNPRALVLTVGTNNMYGDYNDGTDEEIALGIKAILQKIRTKLPNTRILLLSLLPRESPWLVERCENINEAIEKFHDNNWIYFLDVFHDFLESPGFPNKSLFSANLFDLNKAGYEHLANLIEPTMKKIIDYKEAGDITHKKPEHDKPWVPAYGWWGEGIVWKFTHDMLMHQSTVNKSSIEVVFLGDSITQGWSTDGKEVWAEHYAKRGVFNYGIGGDSTRQIIWRLEKGEIDVLYDSMKMIVLMIGTNNLYNDFNGGTDEEIAKAIEIIIDIMHVRFPKVKVLLLGILPRDPASSTRAQNINKMIAKLNGKGNVSFLDMSPEFQESVGKIKTDLYKADTVHLNKNGYQVWQKTMEPLFSKLLEKN